MSAHPLQPGRPLATGCLASALVLVLVLATPGLAASASQVTLSFSAPNAYTMDATVDYTGESARAFRSGADGDGDGTVSGEEASRAKAEIQAGVEDASRSDHRLDGQQPARVKLQVLRSDGLTGPVGADDPVVLELVVRYTFDVPQRSSHRFEVHRDESANRTLAFTLQGPDGWELHNLTGLDGANVNTTGPRETLEAQPTGTFGLTLVRATQAPPSSLSETPSGQDPGPEAPLEGDDTSEPSEPAHQDRSASDQEAPAPTPVPALVALLAVLAAATLKKENNS